MANTMIVHAKRPLWKCLTMRRENDGYEEPAWDHGNDVTASLPTSERSGNFLIHRVLGLDRRIGR